MLLGLFVLLACQLVGEVIVRGMGWPIPGPVIGIVLLFVIMLTRGRLKPSEAAEQGEVAKAADGLLSNLGLVFIPAGVGISQHYQLIVDNGIALVGALVLSTVLTLLVTMGVFRLVSRWTAHRQVQS
ncbi:CidA/LrgA family protein [Devosia sp. RR2S18]|uniref:CidA/LrgA family protein n=1 Tax=Devosia rhizosphaerae TaxID=3049774 RepID=UPI002540A770|nr:CidA/LrgA family protein [Devosia sp. RR2S18]WIJ25115.1 CidA/LrgA family protein [Devosia sp. RR2S18]